MTETFCSSKFYLATRGLLFLFGNLNRNVYVNIKSKKKKESRFVVKKTKQTQSDSEQKVTHLQKNMYEVQLAGKQ